MARLPIPGGDTNEWGSVLNAYLQVSHNADGSIAATAVQQAGAVTSINGKQPTSGSLSLATSDVSDIVPSAPTNGQVLTYDSITNTWKNRDATITSVVGQTGVITGAQIAADSGLTDRYAQLSGAVFTGHVSPAAAVLTFGASIAVNAALGNIFNLTLTASTGTLANPTNPVEGQIIRFRVTQGAGAPYSLAYGSAYNFGAAGQPILSTTTGAVDILAFEYVSGKLAWCYVGAGLGF